MPPNIFIRYNVSVAASTDQGRGPAATGFFWTEIGDPQVPRTPQLVSHGDEDDSGTLHVRLFPVGGYNGPITSYQVEICQMIKNIFKIILNYYLLFGGFFASR